MTAGSFAQREGIRSSAGIPLHVGDETLGILFVNYRERHHFAPQEQAEVELFATQAAIAIYNARLYRRPMRHHARVSIERRCMKRVRRLRPGSAWSGGESWTRLWNKL